MQDIYWKPPGVPNWPFVWCKVCRVKLTNIRSPKRRRNRTRRWASPKGHSYGSRVNTPAYQGLMGLIKKQLNCIISICSHAITIISVAIIIWAVYSWFNWVRLNDQQADKYLDAEIAFRNAQ